MFTDIIAAIVGCATVFFLTIVITKVILKDKDESIGKKY